MWIFPSSQHIVQGEKAKPKSDPELFAPLPAPHLASSPSSPPPTNGKQSTIEEEPL